MHRFVRRTLNEFISSKTNTFHVFFGRNTCIPTVNSKFVRCFSQSKGGNLGNSISRLGPAHHDLADVHETVTVGQFTVILEGVKVKIHSGREFEVWYI